MFKNDRLMKKILLITALFVSALSNAQEVKKQGFYDFTVQTIDGKDFSLAQLRGKKVLVVNTASKCGFTPQYSDLQKLYEQYGGSKFTIIAFPENNFMNQEPGTNEEIKEFCTKNYGVTFPVMAKISVKGKDIAPLYKWLTSKDLNGVMDSSVKWNFQKYMINEDGTLAGTVPPNESPMNEKIVDWIKK
jgi:glutathione peroxidase